MKKKISYLCLFVTFLGIIACQPKPSIPDSQPAPTEKTQKFPVTNATTLPEEDLSGNVVVITEEDFIIRISDINNPKGFQYKGNTPCVVDFYANWCRPCVSMNPIIIELAKNYAGQVIFYKINAEKAQRAFSALGAEYLPTFFLFKKNAMPVKIEGALPKEDFMKAIEETLLYSSTHKDSKEN
ncbi:MAG: thioredoxin family protein [Bacteroidales bacterium]|jgi:thioredoxin-like negative regulator of GroEL|nr:thioredoxin family protein [Bacteroidales bacterium]